MSGEEIAEILGEEPDRVFKTLVTQGKSGAYYVFVIPVITELDLKKAAKASGEKAVSMIKQNSRRYAKRQMTWLRAKKEILWLDASLPADRLAQEAEEIIRNEEYGF